MSVIFLRFNLTKMNSDTTRAKKTETSPSNRFKLHVCVSADLKSKEVRSKDKRSTDKRPNGQNV